jgi:hypothetical protein
MRTIPRIVLAMLILTATSRRLPAPISEVQEKPTPTSSPAASLPKPKPQPIKAPAKRDMELTASEKSVVAAKIKEAMNKASAAWATHDSALMRSLMADNFVSVRPNGNVANKEAFLDEFKSDTSIYEFVGFDSLDVHVDSRTMAVVTSTWRFRGKTISGKHFDNVYRVTDTLTQRNGVWQCTADQAVLVSPR